MWKVSVVVLCSCILAISAKSCTITLPKDMKEKSPVVLTKRPNTSQYGLFRPTGQVSKFDDGSVLQFVCTGKKNFIMKLGTGTSIDLTCSNGQFVDVNKNPIALSTLLCKSIPESTLIITDRKCSNDRGLIYQAGIEIGKTLHRVYEICYDMKSETTFYTHNTLNGAALKSKVIRSAGGTFQATGTKLNTVKVNKIYTKDNQLQVFQKYFGKQQQYYDEKLRFLARGHLTADADFMFGYEQLATYYYVNVAPQFQCINGCNWKSVESKSRALARDYGDDIESYNGYFGVLQLAKPNGAKVKIYLDGQQEFPIPQYYFKVLMRKSDDAAVVFVNVNNPLLSNGKSAEVCPNVCDKAKLTHVNFNTLKKGYTFCCTLDDFKKVYNGLPAEVKGNKLLTGK